MTSEIDKLKHFHVENYSDTNFTDDLNDGEEFLYTTIRCKDDKEVTLLCKYVKNKHIGNCPDCVFNKYLCYGLLCNNADNTDLLILSCNYSIQWKECSCLKGIRLEDVTAELEEEAYEEMRNNK
jgi:hypothetical protein